MSSEEKNEWRVGGFTFKNEQDALLARKEESRVAYLEQRMRYDKPEVVLNVYNKAVDERLFSTPVGLAYLQKIREFLADQGLMGKARDIPIYQDYTYDINERIKRRQARERVEPSTYKGLKTKLRVSLIFNVVLIIAIIAMFIITITSDNPNVLNYERALANKYAQWEQDLSEREKTIRQKERENNIESPALSRGDIPVIK